MNHLTGEDDLLLEARRTGRIVRNFRADDLQRDAGLLEKLVASFVNLAHTTAGNKADHQEAGGDQLPGLEAGLERGQRGIRTE